MITRVWIIFTLSVTAKLVISELMGDHVCEKEERNPDCPVRDKPNNPDRNIDDSREGTADPFSSYTVNVTKYVLRNVTIRSYEWCVQVPPRCSTYSIQQINDTKIEEEEKIRYVKTCCIGYYEVDDGTKCLPDICRSCENGYCGDDGSCHCDIGFWGSYCDRECVGNTWGLKCQDECIDCDEGRCVMQPENCVCPPKSIRCDLICGEGHQNSDCLKQCNCDTMHICDPLTTKCIRVNRNYTEYDYEDSSNYKLVKNKSLHPNRIIYTNDMSTSYESILSTTNKFPSQNTNINDTNHFTTTSMNEQPSTETSTQTKDQHVTEFQITKVKIETSTVKDVVDEEPIESTVNKEIKMSEINENVKLQIANEDKLVNATPITTSNTSGSMTRESGTKQTFEESSPRILIDSHLFVTIISGVIFTVLIILSAAVFYVLYKLKEKRKKYGSSKDDADEKKIGGSISTVSVTARSIFHTPLPEPPVFQNPAFVTPLEIAKQGIFETHVICNMNFPKEAINNQTKQELFYDHPPSTGSYRPASIPEPLSSTCSKSDFDPIYDEIPSNRRILPVATPPPSYTSEESSTLYMNTK